MQSEREYRALITDINLGKNVLNGWEVARAGRELHAQLPVIYITGDSAHDWRSQGVPESILIAKPFAAAKVVTAVAQAITSNSHINGLTKSEG